MGKGRRIEVGRESRAKKQEKERKKGEGEGEGGVNKIKGGR